MKNNLDRTNWSGIPPSSMGGSNNNSYNNKKKKVFTGLATDPVLKGKVITQNNSKDEFEELREALSAFMTNEGHGKLGRNIKGMIKLDEDHFMKTNLDYSTCMKEVEDKDNGGGCKLVITNALKKAAIDAKYNAKNIQEMATWIKYHDASSQALNILEYQLAPAVLAEVKKDG